MCGEKKRNTDPLPFYVLGEGKSKDINTTGRREKDENGIAAKRRGPL